MRLHNFVLYEVFLLALYRIGTTSHYWKQFIKDGAIESAMIPQRKSNKMRKNHVFRSNGSRDMGKKNYGGHF